MNCKAKWQVERLRISTFPAVGFTLPPDAVSKLLWIEVIGAQPDNREEKAGEYIAREMKYMNGRIVLSLFDDRIDWIYADDQSSNSEDPQFPIIGKLDAELVTFVAFAENWLNTQLVPSVSRLAFEAILLKPVDTLSNAYKCMQEVSPFVNLDQLGLAVSELNNADDFEYRVIRRRKSRHIDSQPVHWRSKWEVVTLSKVSKVSIPQPNHAFRLELDMFTPADEAGLSPQSLVGLVHDFEELLRRLSLKGEFSE